MLLRGLLNQKLLLVFIRWICEGLQDTSTMVAFCFSLEKDHKQCLKSEVQPLVFSAHSYSKHFTLDTRSLLFTCSI